MRRPVPSSPDASRRMADVRQKGTGAEVALRREMYRLGLRYRIDYEVLRRPRRLADVAFPGRKIAVSLMAASGMAVQSTPHGQSKTRSFGGRRSKRISDETRIQTTVCDLSAGRCSGFCRMSRRLRLPEPSRIWSPWSIQGIARCRPVRTIRTKKWKMTNAWTFKSNGNLRLIELASSQGNSSKCAVVSGWWPTLMPPDPIPVLLNTA